MTDKTAGLTVYWFGRLPQNVARLSDLPAGFRYAEQRLRLESSSFSSSSSS